MKNSLILIVLFAAFLGKAQQNIKLTINHKLGSQNFALGLSSTNNLGNTFDSDRTQYYLSQFTVIHDGGQNTMATGVYALVDASANTMIDLGSLNITNVEGIKFYVGVNTPENNADPTLWPSTHPLAPKNPSMHWGWASGYFFVAMSGDGGTSLSNAFELHGLGNANYFSQTHTTDATLVGTDLVISLDADYAKALKDIDVSSGIISHGATGQAASIIANFRDEVFTVTQKTVSTVGISENSYSSNSILVYPNPSSTGVFNLNSQNIPTDGAMISISDITGREIQQYNTKELKNNSFKIEQQGIYFLKLYSKDEFISTQKIITY